MLSLSVLELLAHEEDRVVGVLEHVAGILIIVGPDIPLLVQELEPHILGKGCTDT